MVLTSNVSANLAELLQDVDALFTAIARGLEASERALVMDHAIAVDVAVEWRPVRRAKDTVDAQIEPIRSAIDVADCHQWSVVHCALQWTA